MSLTLGYLLPYLPTIQLSLLLLLVIYSLLVSIKLFKTKRALNLLKKDSEEQTSVQRQRDSFLSTLIHDLRSPLSIMKGAADLILKDAHNLNKGQIEILLTQIRTSSSDMLKLVNNIFDVSKIESGKFVISKTFGNVNKTLKDESDYFVAIAGVKNIVIETSFDEGLPSFNYDADRLRGVVNNMLSNAIKVMEDGGKIHLSSKKHQKLVEVSVVDTGAGLTDEQKQKLFQLGIKDKGVGLGLVIAKSIIKAHGGEIRVESNKPKGSKFIFTLPLS